LAIADTARGAAMIRRVVFTARTTGVADEGLTLLEWACRTALELREAALDDDHDPHYLHPARSALILLQDTGELNPVLLAAAVLTESQRPDLALADAMLRESCPIAFRARLGPVLALRGAIPAADDPARLEELVAADEAVRRVALAERLDHVRHVHMWPAGGDVRAMLAEVEALWEPLAIRTHERLARRFRRWSVGTGRKLARGTIS
jgi:hypothetical protein